MNTKKKEEIQTTNLRKGMANGRRKVSMGFSGACACIGVGGGAQCIVACDEKTIQSLE